MLVMTINAKAFDVTEITKILAFTDDRQRKEYYDTDLFSEYALYLVGDGSQTSNNSVMSSYTDIYYGDKKVTDLIITSEYPGNEEYPDDKVYLVPVTSGNNGVIYAYNVYFKHKGIVSEILNSFIKSVQYNEESGMTTIVWNDNTVTGAPDNFVTELTTSDSIYGILQNLKDGYDPSIPIDDRKTQKDTLDILSTSVIGISQIYSEDSATGDYVIDPNSQPSHTVDEYIKKEISDRKSADADLDNKIDQERQDRINQLSWHPVID